MPLHGCNTVIRKATTTFTIANALGFLFPCSEEILFEKWIQLRTTVGNLPILLDNSETDLSKNQANPV